jgi:hypothetical protein
VLFNERQKWGSRHLEVERNEEEIRELKMPYVISRKIVYIFS